MAEDTKLVQVVRDYGATVITVPIEEGPAMVTAHGAENVLVDGIPVSELMAQPVSEAQQALDAAAESAQVKADAAQDKADASGTQASQDKADAAQDKADDAADAAAAGPQQ